MPVIDYPPVVWGRVTEQHERVIIVGSGPSLQTFDFTLLRQAQSNGAFIISVNESFQRVSFANAWFTLDPHHLEARMPTSEHVKKYAAVPEDFGRPWARIQDHRIAVPARGTYLHRLMGNGPTACKYGLCEDTSAVYTGNSAYGALGLAYHMRAKRIAILGVDGTVGYFYGPTMPSGPLQHLPELFASAKPQLDARAAEVRLGSPNSIVTAFERTSPEAATEWVVA